MAPSASAPGAMKTWQEAWEVMVQKGVDLANAPSAVVFHASLYSGFYIGIGAILCTNMAGGFATAGADNPGVQTFVFAGLFPVVLLIIAQTGGVLYTGSCASAPGAWYEGRIKFRDMVRILVVSWVGNFVGGLAFAGFLSWAGLNAGTTATYAGKVAMKKCSANFLQTFLRGIGCNWLVCIAIFMSIQAQDMAGKMVACWFPISAFVMSGFEHAPANMCILPHGLLGGATHDLDVHDIMVKNIIPASLGNLFAGAIMMAFGYSPVVHKLLRVNFLALLTRGGKQEEQVLDLENLGGKPTASEGASSGSTKEGPESGSSGSPSEATTEGAPRAHG